MAEPLAPAGNRALCGLVVTFHPDEAVTDNLRAIVQECGTAIVVDNGSGPDALARLAAVDGVTLVPLEKNLGVATALNRGAGRALKNDCQWVVTFDQDSRPEPGFAAALWATHLARPRAAVIGPCIHEEASCAGEYRWVRRHPRWPGCYERVPCRGPWLDHVTMVVTSGSMVELAAWQALGGFEEGLFIDYVDIDYCLRVIRAGREVAVAGGAVLLHRLGARRSARWLGKEFRPMHHAAFRHYYIARNRIIVWRRHALAVPHWAAFDLCFGVYNLFRVLVFEERRWQKIRAMLRGTWDGLRGRKGPRQ
jgi:rhamnosyltransferase